MGPVVCNHTETQPQTTLKFVIGNWISIFVWRAVITGWAKIRDGAPPPVHNSLSALTPTQSILYIRYILSGPGHLLVRCPLDNGCIAPSHVGGEWSGGSSYNNSAKSR